MKKKSVLPPKPVFVGFEQASQESGLPIWLIRKMTWDGRLPSYHPQGPRGRTFVLAEDIYALMAASRKA